MIIKLKVIESGSLIKDRYLIDCVKRSRCLFVNCNIVECHIYGRSDFDSCIFHNCRFIGDTIKAFNCIFDRENDFGYGKRMVEYFVSGKGATANKNLYHLIRHCKKCNSDSLKFLSFGSGEVGDFGDFYKCEDCGLINDAFVFTKKEYTKDEYSAEALKLQKQIDALSVKLNFYNSKK